MDTPMTEIEKLLAMKAGTTFLAPDGERYLVLADDASRHLGDGDLLRIRTGEIVHFSKVLNTPGARMRSVMEPLPSPQRRAFLLWEGSDEAARVMKLGRSYARDHVSAAYEAAFNAGYQAGEEAGIMKGPKQRTPS